MQLKFIYSLLIPLFLGSSLFAQETSLYEDPNELYKKGQYFYAESLYGAAQEAFKQVIEQVKSPQDHKSALLLQQSELHYAICAIRRNQPDGELLVKDFIRRYEPEAVASQAKAEIGNYYFAEGEYDKALDYFEDMNQRNLSNEELAEYKFKTGYCYFLRKKFDQAKTNFRQIKDTKGDYYYPSNYYYGITEFFSGNYDQALTSFIRVNKSKKYSKVVPYYIAQIYFARAEYQELIDYAEPMADDSRLKYKKELNKLIGQSHFELGQFNEALPYLEAYVENTEKLSQKDLYQVAYTQYKTGNYEEAIVNFEELKSIDSEIGQNALYNMADSYLQNGDKISARNAFLQASKMDYNEEIKEDAQFNYAKLSYELKNYSDAIQILQTIPVESQYHTQAQKLMSDLFLSTRDYEQAIGIIEKMPEKTLKIRQAYQLITYRRGVQLYTDADYGMAKRNFNKSLLDPHDSKTAALAHYWIGEINHNQEKSFSASKESHGKFLALAKGLETLPDEASEHTSNYTMGYNYLKQSKADYNSALQHFKLTVDGISSNKKYITNPYVTGQILPDATLRLADCYFKTRDYPKADKYYQRAIDGRYDGQDYALYQKATILGLQDNTVDQILVLETIINNHKDSEYYDDAFLDLGNVYLEIQKYQLAQKAYTNLLTEVPNSNLSNQALMKLGLISYNQNEFDKAINYYQRIFSNNPSDKEAQDALLTLEEIYIEKGDPDGYIAFLESMPGYNITDRDKEQISFKSAESQYQNGNYPQAIAAYTKYLSKYQTGPNALKAYFSRAEANYQLEQYGRALPDYRKVLEKGSSTYYAKSALNSALISYNINKKYEEAFMHYNQLLQVAVQEDTKYTAQTGVLRSAYRMGNYNGVSFIYPQIIANPKSTNKDKSEAYFYMGKMALQQESYDEALASFNQVIKLVDNTWAAESRYQIAYIYYMQRDLETAKQLCLMTNREIPSYQYWLAKSVVLLGDIFAEQGDLFNAKASLESIVNNYTGDAELLAIAQQKLDKVIEMEAASSRVIEETENSDGNLEMDPDTDNPDNN